METFNKLLSRSLFLILWKTPHSTFIQPVQGCYWQTMPSQWWRLFDAPTVFFFYKIGHNSGAKIDIGSETQNIYPSWSHWEEKRKAWGWLLMTTLIWFPVGSASKTTVCTTFGVCLPLSYGYNQQNQVFSSGHAASTITQKIPGHLNRMSSKVGKTFRIWVSASQAVVKTLIQYKLKMMQSFDFKFSAQEG